MIINWSKNALNDLQNYKQNSKTLTVDIYIHSLIDYINNLKNFHELGKFLFIKKGFEIRQLVYNMHRIFYAIDDNSVNILNISHTSRNMNNIIKYLKNKNFNNLK